MDRHRDVIAETQGYLSQDEGTVILSHWRDSALVLKVGIVVTLELYGGFDAVTSSLYGGDEVVFDVVFLCHIVGKVHDQIRDGRVFNSDVFNVYAMPAHVSNGTVNGIRESHFNLLL